ncbi:hypothetical protein [Pseudomonas sp. dw_612]|uniref:hypothetical protein n=1 Tax=Pseudomonas sp. dw_612 TaxID=2720080 RepID=UPI001BD5325E|nr:hypothetical protein [Pseudomonas sp. dw_612]
MITCDIKEVTPVEYEAYAQSFIELMQFDANVDAFFMGNAEKAANIAESYSSIIPGKKYVALAKKGNDIYGLVGLMTLSVKDAYIQVDYICTHPLTSQGGVLLITHAIEVSKELGKGGTLRLYDASGGSFYDNLGFTPVEAGSGTKQLVHGVFRDRV